jgi:hypothetical protein
MAKKNETPVEVPPANNGPPAETAVTRFMPPGPAAVGVAWAAIRNLQEAVQLAELVFRASVFEKVTNPHKALMQILAGAEMGFGPMASLVDVFFIDGKTSIGAHLRAASIKRSDKYDYRVVERTRERCELEPAGRMVMTFEEAMKSGLALGKDGRIKNNWKVNPDDMLFARCVSKGYRTYCPDLTGGVLTYDPDELDTIPAPLDVEYTVQPAVAAAPQGEPQPEEVPPISEGQFRTVTALAQDVGFSEDDLADRLMGIFGHRSLSSLNAEEAGRLLKKLKATKAAREKAKQVEPAGAPS